ncbi:fructose-2,6-bisphosphatase TIGAR B-like [Saccoglossus kowalevskii]
MLVVTLVRHGETIANKSRIIQGQGDGCLTKLGSLQAEHLGDALAKEYFDIILCSDLIRTQQTAACIMKSRSSQHVYLEPIVRERSAGVIEGQCQGTQEKLAKAARIPLRKYRPDGGESWDDVKIRAQMFGQKLIDTLLPSVPLRSTYRCQATARKKTRVLVVTHGGFIKEFINQWCLKSSMGQVYPNKARNAAIYTFNMHVPAGKSQQPVVHMLRENDVDHLRGWTHETEDLGEPCDISLKVLNIQKVSWTEVFGKP